MSDLELLPVPHRPMERTKRRTRWSPSFRGFVTGVSAAMGLTVVFCVLELVGCGGDMSSNLLLLVLLALLLVVPVGLVYLCFPSSRGFAITTLIAALTAAPLFLGMFRFHFVARSFAFDLLALRSEPLVAAIHAYEARYAVPPEDLRNLVPEFLDEVPGTGMPSCPNYVYSRQEPTSRHPRSWSLRVECSTGLFNWDEFIYLPPHEPRFLVSVTRHGDWVYFHE